MKEQNETPGRNEQSGDKQPTRYEFNTLAVRPLSEVRGQVHGLCEKFNRDVGNTKLRQKTRKRTS